ncbi:transposase [Bacillus cereus]|uniref:transposase n=1 Tax=Bacillus cereus TaxID=1396 RepID=UPI002B23F375|nr:transposase [Bacillus cereus]MEB2584109.1 transposase [Bacillus cereus]MEB2611589.1 transposase [Bacillus cereus]
MAKKGTIFNTYSNEIKLSAVQSYLNGEGSYDIMAEKYQIRSSTQLKNWVKKYKECGEITDTRGKNSEMKGIPNPLKGKRIHFKTVEYLKKQYPNL